MSKPEESKKTPGNPANPPADPLNPMDTFCVDFTMALNKAINAGLPIPQIIMVMEMTKMELANTHINMKKMEEAKRMTAELQSKKGRIIH